MPKSNGLLDIELPLRFGVRLAEADFPLMRNASDIEIIAQESFQIITRTIAIPDRSQAQTRFLEWFEHAYRERQRAIFSQNLASSASDTAHVPTIRAG